MLSWGIIKFAMFLRPLIFNLKQVVSNQYNYSKRLFKQTIFFIWLRIRKKYKLNLKTDSF